MILTKCQENAINTIDQFLEDKNENVMILEGSAGTGKTTVVTLYEKKSFKQRIIYLAPTHKAKNVLKEMGRKEGMYDNGYKFKTIHSFFKLRSYYDKNGKEKYKADFETFQFTFDKYYSHIRLLLIIDEISMINDDIYNIIITFSKKYPNIKMICLGDRNQLSPIFKVLCKETEYEDEDNKDIEDYDEMSIEKLSPFFTNVFKYHIRLNEIKRTNDRDITELYEIFRQYTQHENTDIFKDRLLTFKKLNINSNIKIVTQKNHFTKDVYEKINKESSYVIASRNNTVNDYVKKIRNKLYPESNFPFGIGEKIYFTSFFSFDNSVNCDCGKYCSKNKFYTSREHTIIKCEEKEVFSEYFENLYKHYEFEIDFELHNGEFLKVRKMHPDSIEQFKKDVKKKKQKIKEGISNNVIWREFNYNEKYWNSPFLSSYSITAYKAQGSSYENIFIDGTDIEQCRRTTFLKAKEMYTAITRAKKYICIFIDFGQKYTEIPNNIHKCSRCRCWRKRDQFKMNKKGVFIKTCIPCCTKAKIKRKENKKN